MPHEQSPADTPWGKLQKDKQVQQLFRENEPVIRDEDDEWMMHLNHVADDSTDSESSALDEE